MKRFLLLALTLLLTAPLAHAQVIPVTTDSDDARQHYVQGLHAAMFIDFARARAHFDAALEADPDFALAHLYRGWLSSSEKRAEHMHQAKANAATDAERDMIEAYAANLRDDYERERELHEALTERYPNHPYSMYFLANTESNRDNYAEAVALANRALAADPTFAPAYNLIGYTEMGAGNTAAAEEAFRAQIRLAPDEANPYDSYGEFLLNQGRLDEAEAQYEMALVKNPEFANARTMLVHVAIQRGNRAFEAAVASGDGEGVAGLYTEGGIAYPPSSPPVEGREAIAELFAGYAANGVGGVTLETHEVQVMGDYAHEIGIGRISVGGEQGDPFNYSVLWVKDGDQWRLHRDIWN